MIIKLQGMNNETFFYDTESVKVMQTNYTKEQLSTRDWTFDLLLHNIDARDCKGYLLKLSNEKVLYTELDFWIGGKLINE